MFTVQPMTRAPPTLPSGRLLPLLEVYNTRHLNEVLLSARSIAGLTSSTAFSALYGYRHALHHRTDLRTKKYGGKFPSNS